MSKAGDLRIHPKTGKEQYFTGRDWATVGTRNSSLPVALRHPEAVESRREYSRDWHKRHPGHQSALCKANRRALTAYQRKKYNTDVQFKLRMRLRGRLNDALQGAFKVGSAVRDLGLSIPLFKAWIEGQFEEGMSWDNYGEWHLDHVKPLASFDLTDREQFLEACNWYNYQPLWAIDNLKKGAR